MDWKTAEAHPLNAAACEEQFVGLAPFCVLDVAASIRRAPICHHSCGCASHSIGAGESVLPMQEGALATRFLVRRVDLLEYRISTGERAEFFPVREVKVPVPGGKLQILDAERGPEGA